MNLIGHRKHQCPICNSSVRRFKSIGEEFLKQFETALFPHSIFAFETLNIFSYSCPYCQSSDRARLYKLYFDKYLLPTVNGNLAMLDIAPDPKLRSYLKSKKSICYRSADIASGDVDDNVDITAMTAYKDNQFDFILCSHVLEHVSDDLKAMKELHRVLKPNGKAIVMVPILLTIKETEEDERVTSPSERMSKYAQDDHVRLYSKSGFISRLREADFFVNEYGIDFFGADVFQKHGVADRSVLYVVEKKKDNNKAKKA